jgi:hypothetical protein
MGNKGNYTGIILLVLILAGIILLVRSRATAVIGAASPINKFPDSEQKRRREEEDGMVRYKNTETRKIEWDYDHMVPTQITITRESKQLP